MSFIKSTICSVYNSVKGYFVKNEQTEGDSTVEFESRNLPNSIDDFDKYIEYLSGELKAEMNKMNTFKEHNDFEGMYQSVVHIKTIEICITRLHDIKIKNDIKKLCNHDPLDANQTNTKDPATKSNSENLLNNTIHELDSHITQLNEEYSKEKEKVHSFHESGNQSELNDHMSQLHAIESSISIFSKIVQQLKEQKTAQSNIQNKDQTKFEILTNVINDVDKKIEYTQNQINEELQRSLNYKKQGKKQMARKCLKSKAFKENSIKQFLSMKLMLEQQLEKLQNNQPEEEIIDPNKLYSELASDAYNIKLDSDFEKQIDEEFDKLDVSQIETSAEQDEKETTDNLMEGFT